MICIMMCIITLIIGATALYAEDAAVLPLGTLRIDTDASVGFVREGWDGESRKIDAPDAVVVGAALGLSYGFTPWFTAVLDWSPGVTDTDLVGIDIGNDGNGTAEIYEGLSDFVLKAQFQLIGNSTRRPSDRFRMRVSPGIVIPFPGIDDKDALGNHTWGLGVDVSLDTFIFNNFFVNVLSEAYWFPVENKSKTNNDWEFMLEGGPNYTIALGGASIALALPVNWKVSPENNRGLAVDGVSSHLLSLCPAVTLKLTRPFAVDLGIAYTLPLYGKNNYAVHTITVKAPVYFNFAKDKANNKEGE